MFKKKIVIFLIFVTNLGFYPAKADYPIAQNNIVDGNIVNISKIQLNFNLIEDHNNKLNSILSHFKTPEQQYLPLGLYALVDAMKNPAILKQIRQNGITFVHKYSGNQSIQDATGDIYSAKKAGIAILQNLPKDKLKEGDIFWQDYISQLATEKQIALWYLPEEISIKELPYIAKIADVIKGKDIYNRPLITYVKNYSGNYWIEASKIVNMLGIGIYPSMVPYGPRVSIRRAIDLAYQSGIPLVYFTCEAMECESRTTTPKEIRFDAFLALISGAKTLMWYSYNQANKNNLLDSIFGVSNLLNGPEKLGEVILFGEDQTSVKCRILRGDHYTPPASAYENKNSKIKYIYSSIQWTFRKSKEADYIILVNANEKIGAKDHGGEEYSVKVQFELDGSGYSSIKELLYNKQINVSNRTFTDTIEPIGTRVYKLYKQEI